MKKNALIILVLLAVTTVFTLVACNKNDKPEGGTARFQVYLTDDPGDFEEVLIDVVDVQINVTGDDAEGWQSLDQVNRGVYDLLTLVNDQDTLLAEAEIPAGKVHQIRLILGPENFVKVNGQLLPLTTPSAQQSGLKLNIQQEVTGGLLYRIHLDFDVARSIVETGNGKYILKPVIRSSLESVGGSIKGWVKPSDFATIVYAINGNDTVASTFTGLNGGYSLRGLNSGTYSLYFNPGSINYTDSTRTGINVSSGSVTVVDTLFLQ